MKPTGARALRRPKLPRPALIGVAVVVLALLAVVGWQFRPKGDETPYRTAAVEHGAITRTVSASGVLEPLVTVDVGSQISGLIREVHVDFNDQVRRGQVLAEIDPQTYESRVAQGQAEIAAGTAALATTQAAVREAQARLEVARADYDRKRTLVEQNIYAPSVLEQAEAAYKQAQAGVASAQAQVAQQRARIGQSQAALRAQQVDLGRTTITSPIDGVVVDRQVEPGQTVAASLQAPILFKIAQDLSKVEVKISVDEADIGQVREGQQVRFTVDAFPDDNFTGVVTQVRKQPVTESNVTAYVVMAVAENPQGRLLPGMTANADIILEERRGVMKVPAAALRWTPDGAQQQQQVRIGPPGMGGGFGGPPGGMRQGGGGQGQRAGLMGGQAMAQQLGLDAGQQKKAEPIFAEMREKTRAAMGSGDREAARKAREEAFTKLEAILKPEQKTKLAELRARMASFGGRRGGAGGFTSGVVYVLRDGKPTAVPVQIGATDGAFTEVRGPLKAGDQVITGGGPKPKVQARSPLGGGGQGGATRVRL
ncbi:efflux RND transporter periplasmic adaptor subunit [Phenylobacterium terrae]|uniref:Efflux RND transporter periplasmic adaptor subunit n=1 Tax=Phenylobacterium terrae TaxID=2665495 RepID=A0ABW4N3S0_9CAUL